MTPAAGVTRSLYRGAQARITSIARSLAPGPETRGDTIGREIPASRYSSRRSRHCSGVPTTPNFWISGTGTKAIASCDGDRPATRA